VPAIRVDANQHWDPELFDDRVLAPKVRARLERYPENRLLRHLANCATDYHCFAAKNLFYGRWEAPLPTAPGCNSACVGCLSLQEEEKGCQASHERITFVPTPQEIAEIAVPHLETDQEAIVSFGQGCEGDPLCVWENNSEAIRLIRKQTSAGSINMNTNGSIPEAVKQLARAGMDSIRVSLNSAFEGSYDAYFRPRGYGWNDVLKSLALARDEGLYVSLNLLVFPGVTDTKQELEAMIEIIRDCGVKLIQMRNLSIDPDLYLEHMPPFSGSPIGLRDWMKALRREFPQLAFGYFNKPRCRYAPESEPLLFAGEA
jgi:MoaA/NifB/PqqE/SkfB family radical SAM enzyme